MIISWASTQGLQGPLPPQLQVWKGQGEHFVTNCYCDSNKRRPIQVCFRTNLFDNGSQRSHVTDHIKAKLGLIATSTETLHSNTFGENAYRKQKCQVVTLPLLSNKDEYVEISALNFAVICSPLPKRIDVTKYPHLIDLDLADRSVIDQDSQSHSHQQ